MRKHCADQVSRGRTRVQEAGKWADQGTERQTKLLEVGRGTKGLRGSLRNQEAEREAKGLRGPRGLLIDRPRDQ